MMTETPADGQRQMRQRIPAHPKEPQMHIRNTFIAAAAALAFAFPAMAEGLRPIQNQKIDLGGVAGDAYYTVEHDGFHVVATFAERGGAGTPVRFQALLAPGQSVVFSSPRGEGEMPASVEITRQRNQVLVRKAAVVD
jgi:hypothetical protein